MSAKGLPALTEPQLALWRKAIRKEFGISICGVRTSQGLQAADSSELFTNHGTILPLPDATPLSAIGLLPSSAPPTSPPRS